MKQLTDEELERAAREFRRGIKPSIIAASLGMTEAQMTEALTDFATRKKEAMKQPPFEHPKKEESKREVIVGFEIERNAPSIRETTPLGYIARLVQQLNVGDVVYLTGTLVTCRDVAHRRLIEQGRELPVNLEGGAIFHAGPIVRRKDDGSFEMVSIGPTTSMRMEKFEREFIKQTGVKLIVGKGGMGPETAAGCQENKAVHAIFPGGCAVLAATQVEEIEGAEWQDLGMPETLWINRVKEFGPLIISIDTKGNNLISQNKAGFNEKKKPVLERISKELSFIK